LLPLFPSRALVVFMSLFVFLDAIASFTILRQLTGQLKPNCEISKTSRLFKQIRKKMSNAFDHIFDSVSRFDLHIAICVRKLF
jgi:hypothetical protein